MRHFLEIADFSADELWRFLHTAKELKAEFKEGGNRPLLKGKILGMIFQKPSLRTRVSFEVGMLHLGGEAIFISPNEIGLGKREATSDIAKVLSGYVDGIMARVFSHQHLTELAQHGSVPVINGLSDYNHPCQALSDIFTIWERFNQITGLKLAYVGDGNNVATSLAVICAKLGVHVSIATPKAYQLPVEVVAQVQDLAEETEINFTVTDSPTEAVTNADIIYTDVWTSMGHEAETQERLKVFPPYQINTTLVKQANPEAAIMHCLPAHRGEEITSDVVDSSQSIIFQQAENRLHAQKAVLALLLNQ